jgi:uncharacterized membrane protein
MNGAPDTLRGEGAADYDSGDVLADTLLKLERTIEGSLVFVLGFLTTWWRLCLTPRVVLTSPGNRRGVPFTRPLTFMVLSVVGGSVAVRVLVDAFIRTNRVEHLQVAQDLAAAYARMTFVGTLLEALPVTVGVLGATQAAVAWLKYDAHVRRSITETLCYGVGLQFSLLFLFSLVTIATPASPALEDLAWIGLLYVVLAPSVLMYAYARTVGIRTAVLVMGTLLMSTAVLAVGMALSLLPLALPREGA